MELPFSEEDYIWERGNYLSNHPGHSHRGGSLWRECRSVAANIFTGGREEQLTADEIQTREFAAVVTPRTPLARRFTLPRQLMQPNGGTTTADTGIRQPADLQAHYAPVAPMINPPTPPHDPMLVTPQIQTTKSTQLGSQPRGVTASTAFTPFDLPTTIPVPGVAAMTNRPVHVPIKSSGRPKRNRKEVDYSLQVAPEMEPPTKKVKRRSTKTAKQSISDDEEDNQSSQKARRATKAKKIASPPAPIVVPTSFLNDPYFTQVIEGTALPRHRDEANFAQAERKRMLMAQHKENAKPAKPMTGKGKKKQTATDDTPDLMPEFFERSNFADGENIRCACGAEEDEDESIWIACGTCGAWQHIGCMGDAVPQNIQKDPYHCHVCDPWGHRELLQELRQHGNLTKKSKKKGRKNAP